MSFGKFLLLIFGAAVLSGFCFHSALSQSTILKNAGFVPGNIWFSKIPFFEGDKVRIYTVIFNGSENDLSGTVAFYDNDNLLGKNDFSLAGGGIIRDIWLDWTPSKSNHQISTRIINAKISKPGEEAQVIVLENSETKTESIFADSDTDKDGIGDANDEDDDNDGLTDKEELALGTDPLKTDTDGDGVKDGDEIKKGTDPLKKEIAQENFDAIPKKSLAENSGSGIKADVQKIIPPSILNPAVSAVQKIDAWRESQAKNLDEKVQEIKKEIEADKKIESETKTSPKVEAPFKYFYLFLLSALKFVFEIRLLFYLALFIVIYYFLKFICKRIFRKAFGSAR